MAPVVRPAKQGQGSIAIERIRAAAVRVALPRPVGASVVPLASRDYLCLEVTGSDGLTGIGFSYIGTRGAESALAIFSEMIEPALRSTTADADDPAAIQAVLDEATKIQGRSGIIMNVISAVDIALWDAVAQRRDQTLAACLGASARTVPAYASGGYYLSDDGLPELETELRAWQDLGFTRVKLKVRGTPKASETERLRLAREAIGGEGLLLIDLYHAFRERMEAIAFAERARPFRPWWFEDPFQPDDLASFAWFARRTGCHVATGEFQSNPVAFRHIAATGAASIVQAEAPRCGGVTGWLALADEMKAMGIAMSPCWFHQLHMHLVPAVENGLFVEYFHGTEVLNFDLLIDEPPRVVGGEIMIPDRPGLGFAFDRGFIARHTLAAVDVRLPTRSLVASAYARTAIMTRILHRQVDGMLPTAVGARNAPHRPLLRLPLSGGRGERRRRRRASGTIVGGQAPRTRARHRDGFRGGAGRSGKPVARRRAQTMARSSSLAVQGKVRGRAERSWQSPTPRLRHLRMVPVDTPWRSGRVGSRERAISPRTAGVVRALG